MLIYLVDFSTIHIKTDEETRSETPFALKENSLSKLEELISSYALVADATYVIHNIRYLGYAFGNK